MQPRQRQRIVRTRRQYNQWVGSQTLEDYALRYTAAKARKSAFRVGNTALGAISFLACEAIGGTITIAYGFPNAAWAIAGVALIMFLIGLPIAYYAARYGVDIDLLTRGAGFGYLGSTLTSLIYASFTFLLFSIEASIMSLALQMLFGIPIALAHIVSSLIVIPIAVYGISLISRMQLLTQPIWLILQLLPIAYIAFAQPETLSDWTHYRGKLGNADGSINPLLLGMAASMLLSLLPQIGEQVDYLRFLPERTRANRLGWWTALIANGPGWVFMGGLKLLAGSLLAVLALREGVVEAHANEPTQMYFIAFRETLQSPGAALVLTGLFVIICQLKINVTNAYAGSIAWSNFFARLTHNHPGRVVWLVFNVVLALLLMETGVFHVIHYILQIYASFAAGWIGALAADLVINKPLQLSPPYIEFKRAHLYDINPVGVGAMLLSIIAASLALLGVFGELAAVLAPFVALLTAFLAAPVIAWATRGRFYLARSATEAGAGAATEIRCSICENEFERSDVALCPAYSGPICSLCCTLEARCHDLCKTDSRAADQIRALSKRLLPAPAAAWLNTRGGHFVGLLLLFSTAIGLLLALIYRQSAGIAVAQREAIASTLWLVFLCLLVLLGIVAWLIVLAHENRRTAEAESAHQTGMLMEEIEAHQRTDAALQKAKEVAEAANIAKTRYIVGISHEFRTPLNSIFGYAQLLERGAAVPSDNAVRVIRRSSEHLANLVDGLLDIAKIESGLLRLNRDKVRLVEFLDQLVDMFRLQAEARGIRFEYHPQAHLPTIVYTDQKRLRQILINLLSNAIKYTERGTASLVVRYRSQVAEFEVTDTGVGIPEEDLERIFQPFERGRSAAIRAIPGTGLGLTITKLLTQIMGGDVSVRSTAGTGTTFVVRMLLSEALATHEANSPQKVTQYTGPRIKVLLADDDPTHLHLMEGLLQPLGFTLLKANDGRSCVEMANQHKPDLLMLDISMPDMTGWQVAQELRASAGLHSLKVVIVSANAHEYAPGSDRGELHGRRELHDAFIMKPVDMQALLECIGNLMGLSWIYEPAVTRNAPDRRLPGRLSSQSLHHLDDLYQLGRIGHVRGIEAKLRQIEAEDAQSRSFTTHMRGLVSNFDLKQYMSILEGLRQNA